MTPGVNKMIQSSTIVPPFANKEVKKNKYVLDGKDYFRVTSILSAINKPALIGWKANITLDKARRSLQANVGKQVTIDDGFIEEIIEGARAEPDYILGTARDFGSEAHHALEQYILHGAAPSHVDLFRVIQAFNEWTVEQNVNVLREAEVTVAHSYGFAGTIDAIGTKVDDEELVVIDWKTSGGIYPEAMLQVSAYAAALTEMTKVPVSEAWIVRFPREAPKADEPMFYYARLGTEQLKRNFDLFMAASALYTGIMLKAGSDKLHDGTGRLK